MIRLLLVSCLCMSSCVSRSVRSANETSSNGMTNPNSTEVEPEVESNDSNGTFSVENWWETLTSLDIGDLERYVPQNVKKFVYDTYEDGKDIAYDLYSDIHEEVVEKTQSNVDDFSKFVENLVEEVESIQAEEQKLFLQEEPLSKEEMKGRNKEISESKTKLRQLADNIKEEMKRDEESKEPLERAIQQFITYTRSLISSQFYSMEFMWGRVRQAEGTSYKALELIAKNANEVKALVKDLFEKLSTIDISILGNRKKAGVASSLEEDCFQQGKSIPGNPLYKPGTKTNKYTGIASPGDCQALCQETDGCAWFNWKKTLCYLKSSPEGKEKESKGGVTGPRECPGMNPF